MRSTLAAKQIWVAVITIGGTLDSRPRTLQTRTAKIDQLGYSNAHLFRVIIIATIKENSCLFFLQKTEEKSNEIIWKFLKR